MTSYTVIPKNTRISVPVPSEYIGKRILISMSLDAKNQTSKKMKLSERFAGCISKERGKELQKELEKARNEWERDIY